MLPSHYGFSPGLSHCLVKEPQGKPIRCLQAIEMMLAIAKFHLTRIKALRETRGGSGLRPTLKRFWPPDIITKESMNSTYGILPQAKSWTTCLVQTGQNLWEDSLLQVLSPRTFMPNRTTSPANNIYNPPSNEISNFLL